MSLARKFADPSYETAAQPRGPSLAIADAQSRPGANAVLEQHARLTSAFAAGSSEESYPGVVKLALFVGAPTALWAGVIVAGSWILHRFG